MATIRSQIKAQVITELNTGIPSGVPVVTLERLIPYEASELPAQSLYVNKEKVRNIGGKFGPIVERTLEMVLLMESSDPADIEVMAAWATKTLMGSNLAGLALRVDEDETDWSYVESDDAYIQAKFGFSVYYQTKTNDQEVNK